MSVFLWTLHLESKNKQIYQSALKLVRTKNKKFFSFHTLLLPSNFLLLKSVPKKMVQTMKRHSYLPASNRLPQGGRAQAQADIFSFWLLLPQHHRTATEKLLSFVASFHGALWPGSHPLWGHHLLASLNDCPLSFHSASTLKNNFHFTFTLQMSLDSDFSSRVQ